jgi:AraC family transcriptional regulator, ethanolamine operon transcriptional activator
MIDAHASANRPAVTMVELTDPTTTGEGFELLEQDAVQLQSSPLRIRRVVVRLGDATVAFQSTNLRVRTRTAAREGLLAYVTFGPQTTGTVNGMSVRPDLMLAASSSVQANFVADAGWESITFLFPPDYIGAHLSARQRSAEFRLPQGLETLQADAAKVRALFDWGKRLVDTATSEPALFNDHADKRSAAQVELIETLLATLSESTESEPARKDLARQEQSRIVKTAEEYALSQVGERIYVSDLCRIAAVSERALEYAFKEVMGLTPVTYLIRLRLHRVRQALLKATQGSTTVSTEALNWGFWHFGEFSRAYKDCFGELPSDTLRRAPGER